MNTLPQIMVILAPGNKIEDLYDEHGDIRVDVLYMTRQQKERHPATEKKNKGEKLTRSLTLDEE